MLYLFIFILNQQESQELGYVYKDSIAKNHEVHAAMKNIELSAAPVAESVKNMLTVCVQLCFISTENSILNNNYWITEFQFYQKKYDSILVNDLGKNKKITAFLESFNRLDDIRDEFDRLKFKSIAISKEPSSYVIGPIEFLAGNYRNRPNNFYTVPWNQKKASIA